MSMKSAQRFGLIAPANQICLSIRVWPIKYNFHSNIIIVDPKILEKLRNLGCK